MTQEFNNKGYLISETFPSGNKYIYEYDERGNQVSYIQPDGSKYTYEYDSRGNKISEIWPDGSKNTYGYDSRGNNTSTTFPDGSAYLYEFDDKGEIISTTFSDGKKTNYLKMTRKTAKEHLEFITAFANGETIQYLDPDGEWYDHDEPAFVQQGRYRVKPKRAFALYNEKTKGIKCLYDEEINLITPYGWEKVELIKFNE